MYLHLGSDVVVSQSEIIAIFDLDTTSISKITRDFYKTYHNRTTGTETQWSCCKCIGYKGRKR